MRGKSGGISVKKGVRLKNYTSFHIGGKAEMFCTVNNAEDIPVLLREYRDCPVTFLGRGSNVLVADKGVKGLVVLMRTSCVEFGNACIADAGVPISSLSANYVSRGLGGLEWACCIPGSLGGAVKMNAGAHGGSVSDVLEWVEVLRGGEVVRLSRDECRFAYRESAGIEDGDVILRAALGFEPKPRGELAAAVGQYKAFRKQHQPAGFSAGSVFRAADKPAGYYIDGAGLKGLECGGAFVSPVHANFIINSGFATAENVAALIDEIKARVLAVYGVNLKEEIIYLGEFEK